jgi:hypothetical protein
MILAPPNIVYGDRRIGALSYTPHVRTGPHRLTGMRFGVAQQRVRVPFACLVSADLRSQTDPLLRNKNEGKSTAFIFRRTRLIGKSAVLNLQSLLVIVLLLICTCACIRSMYPSITIATNKDLSASSGKLLAYGRFEGVSRETYLQINHLCRRNRFSKCFITIGILLRGATKPVNLY